MLSITPMMSAICPALCEIASIVATTSAMARPPLTAASVAAPESWLASPAVSALLATVAVICVIELEVCCTLEAACSVRELMSLLPRAISWLAAWTLSTCSLTSSISQRNIRPSWLMVRRVMPISSTRSMCTAFWLSPDATRSACCSVCSSGRAICACSHHDASARTATCAAAKPPSAAPDRPAPQAPASVSGSSTMNARRIRQRTGMTWKSERQAISPVRTIRPLWNFRLSVWPARKSR